MHIGGILPSVGKVSQELLKVAPETPIQYIIAMECNAQGKKDEIYTQQNKFWGLHKIPVSNTQKAIVWKVNISKYR